MANELFLNLGHVIPMGQSDLLADDLVPKYAKGQLSFTRDAFGLRIFQYMRKATATACVKGGLYSREANTTITNIDSGTTTSVTKAGAGWTVDAFKDRLLICTDDGGGAGAAPEGEVGVIVSNTATVINIDGNRPASATFAVNDDFTVYSLFDLKASAANDLAINVVGLAMQAVTSGNWGMFQIYGFCPDAVYTAAAVVAGDPVIAGTASVNAFGASGQELWVGWSPNGMSVDNANAKALLYVDLFSEAGPGTAP